MLMQAGVYRQACYFFLQSMEKRVRAKAFSIVDASRREIRDLHRDHSVDAAITFLLEVIRIDEHAKEQIKTQLHTYFSGDINFRHLHNNLRYPYFDAQGRAWLIDIGPQDCELLQTRLGFLKNFLVSLDRYR